MKKSIVWNSMPQRLSERPSECNSLFIKWTMILQFPSTWCSSTWATSLVKIYISFVPLTHPPRPHSYWTSEPLSCYLPIHQLTSPVTMDTIKHAKNTAKRDHDPCLLPRGSYAWAQRHGSWCRTIQFNSLEWDMRAMTKKTSHRSETAVESASHWKALVKFECFPVWFISYLI